MKTESNLVAVAGVLEPTHVGQYFADAAERMGCLAVAFNTQESFAGSPVLRRASWKLFGHRPPALRRFSAKLLAELELTRPRILVTTGIAPITAGTLEKLGDRGVRTALYLTDDPWNPAHRAGWFLEALPIYDHVFSTRRSTLGDLAAAGCRNVTHLPFAYEPTVHFPETPVDDEVDRFASDVVFVGGADHDRVGPVKTLIEAGFDVALYGRYWDRYDQTKGHFKGHADASTARKAIGQAKVALCLVRRANRDGTSMRTFEVPAMGGCPLVERTEEHVELFGEEGQNVTYFGSDEEMVAKARSLAGDESRRKQLAESARALITSGAHTYEDRLRTILNTVNEATAT